MARSFDAVLYFSALTLQESRVFQCVQKNQSLLQDGQESQK